MEEEKYLKGNHNKAIRYYFYLTVGLGILNECRNLFLGILAIYFTFKITSIPLLVAIFITSIVTLTIIGYYFVHHVSKVKDFLTIKFGSHYGIKAFDYQQGQYTLLKEIKDKLK